MITPSLPLGIGFHAAGAFLAANCYAPQKYVKGWAWEIFWMAQAGWCWLLWPLILAFLTVPHLSRVLAEAPHDRMLFAFLMGVAYGVGGTAFNISIRYIGFALTYSIAVGLSSVLGTLVPPLVRGEVAAILRRPGAAYVLLGVAAGAAGIAICGMAGRLKERSLRASEGKRGEFSLSRGLTLSLIAGVLSAVYGMALEVAAPVANLAEQYGAGIWKGNVSYMFVNTGAFVTSLLYSLYLARRHGTLPELVRLPAAAPASRIASNHLFALLTGTLWYGQFFFYNLGHVRLGAHYAFSSWAIHMILLVLLSNLLALVFREWGGCSGRTFLIMGMGIAVLCAAVVMLTYGNRLGEAG
ncbi:RhaT l-rhamnose-proton symport 2 [Candidatus Sulfopaludibacter sp. SbA3]|nr:RhaT l-rhamnose-proton symport 2 [Candidatus Sulfopaludibacter sp. SbA3]